MYTFPFKTAWRDWTDDTDSDTDSDTDTDEETSRIIKKARKTLDKESDHEGSKYNDKREDCDGVAKKMINDSRRQMPAANVPKADCKPEPINVDECLKLNHNTPIAVDADNWPTNVNRVVPEYKLCIRSSLPIVVAPKNIFNANFEKLTWVKWLRDAAKSICFRRGREYKPDSLIIKGGAVVDMMLDKTPKDYDIFNTTFSIQEMVWLVDTFCHTLKRNKISSVDVTYSLVKVKEGHIINFHTSFEMSLEDVVLEFIVNYEHERVAPNFNCALVKSHLPDQIYVDLDGNVFSNEFTLWYFIL